MGIDLTAYNTVGWRVTARKYEIGDEIEPSYDFLERDFDEAIDEHGLDNIERLDGVSTFGLVKDGETDNYLIDLWAQLDTDNFFGDVNYYLVAGEDGGYGDDAGERIIKDAEVIAIIR